MNAHFLETKELVNNDKQSDSFAKHFAMHFKKEKKRLLEAKLICKVEILWKGKPISSVKTFKKLNHSLCTKERLEICRAMKN